MPVVSPEAVQEDPAFITYLLAPVLCDSFFIVGNKDLVEPERIGVVKKMLLAHSVVLRSDMFAREMEDKKDVAVSDIYPDTFKNLLRFVYGYDNTGILEFDKADNLLYVAEKYQIDSLKARVATRLIKLLTPENICSLLNNPACSKVLELDSAITRILQYETKRVLASPQFLDLSPDALVKVVEQEALNIPEIDVWKAAILWARHRTPPASGEALRQALEKPAKHIRVCTIDGDSLLKEIFTTGVLTGDEVKMVCLSRSSGHTQEGLVSFSNELKCRGRNSAARVLTFNDCKTICTTNVCIVIVLTKSCAIELLPMNLKGKKCPYELVPKGLTYEFKCTTTITRVTDYSNDTSTETPETITVSQRIEYDKNFSVPLAKDGKNIVLLPNNRYRVDMKFSEDLEMCLSAGSRTFEDEHLSVTACNISCISNFYYCLPISALRYRPLP